MMFLSKKKMKSTSKKLRAYFQSSDFKTHTYFLTNGPIPNHETGHQKPLIELLLLNAVYQLVCFSSRWSPLSYTNSRLQLLS